MKPAEKLRNCLSELALSGTELLSLLSGLKELQQYIDMAETLQKRVEELEIENEQLKKNNVVRENIQE